VKINAPEFFKDEAFIEWLNTTDNTLATWHDRGELPSEWSDIFVTICDGEGSNSDMPSHIWRAIDEAVAQYFGRGDVECLLWITNL
jgi:hypothetical protein